MLLALWFCGPALPRPAAADLPPGETVGPGNWQEARGLLPEPVLEWVRKGDVLKTGRLNFDPSRFYTPEAFKSLEQNLDRFDLDEEDVLVETGTGKLPAFLQGIPFPRIDPADPRAGAKIMYNKYYYNFMSGGGRSTFQTQWIARTGGVEREIEAASLFFPMDGHPGAQGLANPDGVEKYMIVRVLGPYDVAGTNTLLWRYRDNRPDSTFAYVPAIRRVRQMSPANRSDAHLGTDFCMDDAWGFDGKVGAFTWKLLRVQEALLPFAGPDAQTLVPGRRGEWQTNRTIPDIVFGYQKKDWTGSPWFPTNILWARRPAYVVEIKAKDPYYNYGPCHLWIEASSFQVCFKVVHDRSGRYWKVVWQSLAALESPDGSVRTLVPRTFIATDDRSGHSTSNILFGSRNVWTFRERFDLNDFSLAGFQRLCK